MQLESPATQKVFLSQIARQAVQSPWKPFSCLPFVSFLSPFFVQSCVPITLPCDKENCKVTGMKGLGIWMCSEPTNPHPVFHCCYKQCWRTTCSTQPCSEPRRRQGSREHPFGHPRMLLGALATKETCRRPSSPTLWAYEAFPAAFPTPMRVAHPTRQAMDAR